jgi:hypothetical protein
VVENSGFKHVVVVQKTAEQSPQIDFCDEAVEREVDVFIIGETSFVQPSNPDNYLYWAFSTLKRMVVGRMSDYIVANAKCRVVVVPDPSVGTATEPTLVAVDGAPQLADQNGSSSSVSRTPSRANSSRGQIMPGLFVDPPSDEDVAQSDDDPNGDNDVVPFYDSDESDAPTSSTGAAPTGVDGDLVNEPLVADPPKRFF